LFETFVINEITKLLSWSKIRAKLYHFRTTTGIEVDCIVETSNGDLIAIKIKKSEKITASDFKGITQFQSLLPDRFHTGIVLYTGDRIIPFSQKLFAIPVSMLWQ
jgi:uncharacterized protein